MQTIPKLKPAFDASPESSGRHLLVLTHSQSGVPPALSARIPARFAKGHPALAGQRGAKLVVHAETSILVLGLGDLATFTAQEAAEWGEHAAHALNKERVESVQVVFPDELRSLPALEGFLKGLCLGNHRIDEFKTSQTPGESRPELKEIHVSGRGAASLVAADFERVAAVVEGISFARQLVELPAGTADPKGIVDRFRKAAGSRLGIEVWDEKKIRARKMGLLGAVSAGSHAPPRFLIVRYSGTGKGKGKAKGQRRAGKTLFLVGKGVTFDTGGVNLKTVPWRELLWMKKDMGGAAAVLGAMLSLARLRPSVDVVGVTPLTTNSLGSSSINPGDIVTSFAGKTVEIQNTDAEGRLILADALHYAVLEKADYIVDVATLTGACAVALGAHHSGLFSNDPAFAEVVRKASEDSGEPAWPMPMSPRYGEELKSQLADLSNMGKGRDGGAQLGAKFLENFVAKKPWVHLDIAGTVDLGEPAAGGAQVQAAGRMVHTFVTLARELAR